jgi:hypothetical protein
MLILKNSIQSFSFLMIKTLALIIIFSSICTIFIPFPINILTTLLVVLQAGLIYEYRNFKPFAILLLFALPYTLVAFFHFNNSSFPLHLGNHTDFDNDSLYTKTFIILCVFWSSLTLILPQCIKPIVLNQYLVFKNQPIVYYLLYIIQIIILVFGRSGNTIFQSGGYGSADMVTSNLGGTAIFEYFIVFYPITFIFSGKNRFRLFLLILLAAIYSFKAILFGGRVEFLQSILLVYILHFDSDRISLLRILLYSILPISFFIFFGFIRSAPNVSVFEIGRIAMDIMDLEGYTFLGNQIDVFYSSTRLYGLIDINVLSTGDRVSIFLYNVLAIITPYSLLPEKANLALYLQDAYSAGGGGLLPSFFYVYLSYPGVVLIGFFMGFLFSKVMKSNPSISPYWVIYLVMILSTYPRWYAYSSNVIYKFCFYSVIIYWFINVFISTIKRVNNDNWN